MKKIIPFLAILTVFTSLSLNAQNNLPPIIDREILFGNPEISGAQLSPDGKWMSFIKPYNEVSNIWIKKFEEPFEDAKPMTASTTRPIPGYFWSRDSKYLLYVQDKGGNENFHVYALDPFSKPPSGSDVPEARNLTDGEGVRAMIYSVPRQEPDYMYVGLNDRDQAWHDLYKVQISTGKRELIHENNERIGGWEFDWDGKLRMASRTAEDGSTELLSVKDGKFEVCYSCSVLETCGILRFHKNGKQAYLITNKGDLDLTQLELIDPETGKTEFVEADPEKEADFGGSDFSSITRELVATYYVGDKARPYFKDETWEKEYNWLKEQLPGVEINLGSKTLDERRFIVSAGSDVNPGATYLYDRDAKTLTFQYKPRPKLPVEHLAKMEPLRYKSTDGLEIPAYLTLPKGVEPKNLPLIVMPHGGPWARDYWGYNPFAQFLANRGYAVLNVNFRGSTGYGKAFLNAGNGEWGVKMQDDLTNGAKYLIEKGIADKDKIGIMGGSYGGYATLAGLTFTPDIYAAGVSIVGPSNLLTLLESIPPYWEAIRNMFYERMGDPNTPEGKKLLMERSPLFSADKIRVPLMVVQGANDPRVKKAESDQIVVAMRDLGLPVEYLCAPDEGHGYARPENNQAFLAAAERFLAKHLGGRYQEDIPDDIAKRLEEITVDISTVTKPEEVAEDKLNGPLPKPVADLAKKESAYKMKIEIRGQEIPFDVSTKVEKDKKNWVITQTASSAMGVMKEVCTVKRGSLEPVSRMVDQQGTVIKLEHGDGKVTGSMTVQGQEKPIEETLENPVFGDGAALYEVLSTLPLKEGYTAVYRTFDLQAQKVVTYEINVVAKEMLTVPAGEFEVYKAEIKDLVGNGGDSTYWLSTVEGKRGLVKSVSTLPQMGGAVLTLELFK